MKTEDINKSLLALINIKFFDKDHAEHLFRRAVERFITDNEKRDEPQYSTINLGNQPYVINYLNRRHIFAYNPSGSSIVLTSDDNLYNTTLLSNVWSNISYPVGTRLSAASGQFVIKCTNESIP